jgi:hypothetical protein
MVPMDETKAVPMDETKAVPMDETKAVPMDETKAVPMVSFPSGLPDDQGAARPCPLHCSSVALSQ